MAPPAAKTPPAQPLPPFNLPLSLLRHGAGLIGFGLFFGFVVPFPPYPRLGLTAHIQFAVEGTMVVAAGLLLNSRPFTATGNTSTDKRVVDHLRPWQRRVVHWGMAGIWVTLMSEVANAWWGTQGVLTLAHQAAGLQGPAAWWMEKVVEVAHYPFGVALAAVVSWISCCWYLWDDDDVLMLGDDIVACGFDCVVCGRVKMCCETCESECVVSQIQGGKLAADGGG